MARWIGLITAAALVAASLGAGAAAAERVALLIGNSDYAHTSRLANPSNDVRAMVGALEALGFETEVVLNAGERAMGRAIRDFGRRAERADTALLFYSGHGMEIRGRNYLVPIDAELERPGDANFEALPLAGVVSAVSGARRLSIVVIDACRNNRFPSAQRDGVRGFAPVKARPGQLIAFATAPGEVAFDGAGALSPYSQALSEALTDPAVARRDVRQLFGGLGPRVTALAGGAQEPFLHAAGFGFETVTLTGAPAPALAAESGAASEARAAFDAVKDSGDAALLELVATRFPESFWGALAAKKAKALLAEKEQAARDRGSEDIAAAEISSEERAAQERAAQERAARERAAEEGGQRVDGGTAPIPAPPPAAADPSEETATERPAGAFGLSDAQIRETQRHLERLRLYRGGVDGQWGPGSTRALQSFQRQTGVAPATGTPTLALIDALKATPTPAGDAESGFETGGIPARAERPVRPTCNPFDGGNHSDRAKCKREHRAYRDRLKELGLRESLFGE